MTVHELPPEEIAKLREKAKPVIAKYTKDIGEELVTEVYAEIEKVRAAKVSRSAPGGAEAALHHHCAACRERLARGKCEHASPRLTRRRVFCIAARPLLRL